MEITTDNFIEKAPQIINEINECKAISFDLEMSGINLNIFN